MPSRSVYNTLAQRQAHVPESIQRWLCLYVQQELNRKTQFASTGRKHTQYTTGRKTHAKHTWHVFLTCIWRFYTRGWGFLCRAENRTRCDLLSVWRSLSTLHRLFWRVLDSGVLVLWGIKNVKTKIASFSKKIRNKELVIIYHLLLITFPRYKILAKCNRKCCRKELFRKNE